jgi:hypothetical protein
MKAPLPNEVTARVKELVKDKIIVGHAVFNDLAVSCFSYFILLLFLDRLDLKV